jgi:DnaK suppressor protein
MTTHQIPQAPEFERLLQRRQEDLQQALAALREGDAPSQVHEVSDFKDVALRHADTEMDEAQAQRFEAALRRVAAARGRLAAGTFGICLQCGQALDLRRLQTLPEAELCTTCQADREAHKGSGRS